MPSRKDMSTRATAKWLSIVGIGEDGVEGLGAGARRAVGEAEFVYGGARHLRLAKPLIAGAARPWPSPFDTAMADVLALAGQKVCVLASGDPFCHGVGATLARHVEPSAFEVFPAPSAFSLAAARLGWALQQVETVSLHGRSLAHIRPLLHEGTRILALTSDGTAPAALAALVAKEGFGASGLHVLEALGGPEENVLSFRADAVGERAFAKLNVVALEVQAGEGARVIPFAAGLDDDLFEHDGQITKREVRAVTLSSLWPRRGALLWDIGAGAGSIAISWMLTHPSLRAIAVEADAERAGRIERNAERLGVPGLVVVNGRAPGALARLPVPDAVFIGGGGSTPGVADGAVEALTPGGRLVANAVTMEMEAMLLALHSRHGGELTRLSVSRAAPVGGMRGWRTAMPVTQWTWRKP